ncbi:MULTISPECIES: CIS tube protein [unclassified Nocardioides]|uniref:CIS tube protein n=1 Tax=unclassified Nocardioides TaxID=2615069 RepID=UPI0006F33E97|nr:MULTISPECIES: LysM peptidoglycan-binding domain-containing protein [unclassified Nocardioides]KRA29547.1 peptidase M23 [Nocardioides sp. Root614]KRA88278.1 peptidase M23 [Nocardioides sp. Root682]
MSSSPVGFQAAGAGGGGGAKLEQAYLQVYEPSKDGSLAAPGPKLEPIKFQFNPKELSLQKTANWKREEAKGNKSASPPEFKGAQPSKLTLELFLDCKGEHDTTVVQTVEKLFMLTVPLEKTLTSKKPSPPWVVFRWGSLTGFLGYVSQVQAKYTLFTSGGVPIRATCTVTLEELSGGPPKQNPTSGGLVPHRVHQVVEGDSLPAIAYAEYGKPSLWRPIAELNRIDDPARIRPGTELLLPALEEIESESRPRRKALGHGAR